MPLQPKEIIEKVSMVPPFQQNSVEASYSEQEISWRLAFNSISQINNSEKWHVMSRNPDGYPWVYFDVDIEEYPQFKTLHQDDELIITGLIERVSGHDINLKSIKNITFPKIEQENAQKINTSTGTPVPLTPWYKKSLERTIVGVVVGSILYYFGFN